MFSIPYIIEWLLCFSPLISSPFQVRLTTISDCYRISAFGRFISFFSALAIFMLLSIFSGFMAIIKFMVFRNDLWKIINENFRIIIYYFILQNTCVTAALCKLSSIKKMINSYVMHFLIKTNRKSFGELCLWLILSCVFAQPLAVRFFLFFMFFLLTVNIFLNIRRVIKDTDLTPGGGTAYG